MIFKNKVRSTWCFARSGHDATQHNCGIDIFKSIILFVLFVIIIPVYALSDGHTDKSKLSPTGIPIASNISIEVEGIRFSIPAVYLQTWPNKEILNRLNVYHTPQGWLKGFDFNYWMPTGRPEVIKTDPPMVVPALIERGARPAPDEYPISILHAKIVPPTGLDNIRPTQRFRNLRVRESDSQDISESMFGLNKYILGKDRTRTRLYYNSDENTEMLIECLSADPSPKCSGDIYLPKKQISFRLIIPEENLKDWQKVLDMTERLIKGWRTSN